MLGKLIVVTLGFYGSSLLSVTAHSTASQTAQNNVPASVLSKVCTAASTEETFAGHYFTRAFLYYSFY